MQSFSEMFLYRFQFIVIYIYIYIYIESNLVRYASNLLSRLIYSVPCYISDRDFFGKLFLSCALVGSNYGLCPIGLGRVEYVEWSRFVREFGESHWLTDFKYH